jgi:hypothetical protein
MGGADRRQDLSRNRLQVFKRITMRRNNNMTAATLGPSKPAQAPQAWQFVLRPCVFSNCFDAGQCIAADAPPYGARSGKKALAGAMAKPRHPSKAARARSALLSQEAIKTGLSFSAFARALA